MNNFLFLLLSILACYRLAILITLDEGPFGIILKARTRLGAYDYGPNGEARTNLGRGITCPRCIGMWVAIPLALYLADLRLVTASVAWGDWAMAIPYATGLHWYTALWWLAIAGGSSFLWSLNRDN
jgi:hypothetical protein